jgi:hypothetical protein
MATTEVTSWAVDLSTLGPIYPFVGSEMLWFLLGLAFWIGFHVWQIRAESRAFKEDMSKLRTPADIEAALAGHRLSPAAAPLTHAATAPSPLEERRVGAD